ncbi:MAG: tetratricopeptide repeat protein [Truepera sp.]|nr:tetratricopeptide repeat protein [Truepera sp.]
MRTLLISLGLLLLWPLGWAQGITSVAVYPFSGPDVILGTAVADRVAEGLVDDALVIGVFPTPVLVPPLVAEEGFFNPLAFLNERFEVAGFDGAAMVRETLGVDIALTGSVTLTGERLRLDLYLATPERVTRYILRAPQGEPGRLAVQVLGILNREFDLPVDTDSTTIDLLTAYGDYVQALALLSGGFTAEALARLTQAVAAEEAEAHWQELLGHLQAWLAGGEVADPLLWAALELTRSPLDNPRAIAAFQALAAETEWPLAQLWVATLRASINDHPGARAAFEQAARYPYGLAARAVYRAVNRVESAHQDLTELVEIPERSALLGAQLAAQQLGETALEIEALALWSRVAPFMTYPFERRSFIAFDQDDALAAAQALVVAVSLAPESDLYWTNLGWAYYLLGFLERSERASLRALELNDQQYVAWYNLGLVQAVTDRLSEAMEAYQHALAIDPGVEDEAIVDLENALTLYPDQIGVHFALATLYEAEGRREEAATQFEQFLARGGGEPFAAQARQRIAVLRAPPPPLEITSDITLSLGARGPVTATFQPGDRLVARFELSTPGFELPSQVMVTLRLQDADLAALSQTVSIPRGAVAFVIGDIALDLPATLAAGSYRLSLSVSGLAEQLVSTTVPLEVTGSPSLLRRLVSRGIVLRTLDTDMAIYTAADLARSEPDLRLVEALLQELRLTAAAAQEALPEVTVGRFAGKQGGALFRESTADDVHDFLGFVLAQAGLANSSFTFVDLYAQWALDGAPAP